MLRVMARTLVFLAFATVSLCAQITPPHVAHISYADASPVLAAFGDSFPADLKALSPAEIEADWPAWVSRRDAGIRARLLQGDEDSLVNFLFFGTTFTRQPRALNDSAKLGGRESAGQILRERISDLVSGIASPGANERLQFARRLVERRGIDPRTAEGQAAVRGYLLEAMRRVVGEVDDFVRTLQSAKSSADPGAELAARSKLFRARSLSSDTSLLPDFAVEQALAALVSAGRFAADGIHRVAIVGPGLDFTDKAEGYDFYPQQTIQPFSVIDSLMRLGLAPSDLRVTTFDLSPRINEHLEAARQRARAGGAYSLQLPRDVDAGWRPELLSYWQRFGDRIGEAAKPVPIPAGLTGVQVRAVRIRPSVVLAIGPEDLNIVLQRREPLRVEDRFDLVIATNVLVYYDVFEQSLALVNVAKMLRPGGILLSNNALPDWPAAPAHRAGSTAVVYSDRADDRDLIVWYIRGD
jgi:SAM-dependent methyltransferase